MGIECVTLQGKRPQTRQPFKTSKKTKKQKEKKDKTQKTDNIAVHMWPQHIIRKEHNRTHNME